ncbi:hypothetical protein EYR40_010037 [Pleurotus pulmonarius]|nr:hypothetical protein EYR40_010037 [Pleurotus pulmonarius]
MCLATNSQKPHRKIMAPALDVTAIHEEVEEGNNCLAEVEIDELDGDDDLDISTEWLALTECKHKLDSSSDAKVVEKKPKVSDTMAAKEKPLALTSVESSTPAAPSKQQPPRLGTSEPVSSVPHSKKGHVTIDKFADATARQEETAQKMIELKTAKIVGQSEAVKVMIRAWQAKVKMNKDKLRAEMLV